MPAVSLAGGVLEREGIDALAHVHCLLLVGLARLQRSVHCLEECRGREFICQVTHECQPEMAMFREVTRVLTVLQRHLWLVKSGLMMLMTVDAVSVV